MRQLQQHMPGLTQYKSQQLAVSYTPIKVKTSLVILSQNLLHKTWHCDSDRDATAEAPL